MKNFAHSDADRSIFVKEMLREAAGNSKACRAQLLAIEDLRSWYANGERGAEPVIEDIAGLTWKMACAISTDLKHIFREERPEGVYGSEYERTFVRLRQEARRMARIRQSRKGPDGLDTLRNLLSL